MANWSNEAEAREQIKALVAEYYHDFKEKKADFKPGDRVTYASRGFDEKDVRPDRCNAGFLADHRSLCG